LLADVTAGEVEATLDFQMGFGFDLLGEQLAENHLLSKVFGTDDGVVGTRRCATGHEEASGGEGKH
jgi:hypothetical protein